MIPKSTFTRIGIVRQDSDGTWYPEHWTFNNEGPMFCVDALGVARFFGWTIDELKQIATRPSEFIEIQEVGPELNMTPDDEFARILMNPFIKKKPDMPDDEAYQRFVESMVPHCHCADRYRPCDGVLAGGLCDHIKDDERDDPLFEPEEYDDL